jgi:hemerythrin
LKLANTKNYRAIKRMVRTLSKNSTADDMVALLEEIEIHLKDEDAFIKKEEDLK